MSKKDKPTKAEVEKADYNEFLQDEQPERPELLEDGSREQEPRW